MIDKNKSLIKSKKNIFKRFIDYIKNIFKKKIPDDKKINEKDSSEQITEVKEKEEVDKIKNNQQTEKEKFFKIYSEVKSRNIKMDELSPSDLIKFNLVMKEEIRLKKEKVLKQRELIQNLTQEINQLKLENKNEI